MSTTVIPAMRGKHWTVEEETALLDELAAGMSIEEIAQRHARTTGGIDGRRGDIAYKMHINSIPLQQISAKILLDETHLTELFKIKDSQKRTADPKRAASTTAGASAPIVSNATLEKELNIVKKELRDTKAMVEEILTILKAVYEVSEE